MLPSAPIDRVCHPRLWHGRGSLAREVTRAVSRANLTSYVVPDSGVTISIEGPRRAVNALVQIKDQFRYLRLSRSYVGYQRERFLYDPIERGSKHRRRLLAAVGEALGIIVENSSHPLRVVTILGILVAGSNLLYTAYVFAIYFFKEDVLEGVDNAVASDRLSVLPHCPDHDDSE